ncbi:MAG: DUF58 domain-containing protein [Nanoarchaeota archaeon]|nr:DUF58 domain-containing protein [Nanoarchaeota archaeon]MBU4283859.1 DUF58 domain-containing protein [Nanoarchaeota archaeon]
MITTEFLSQLDRFNLVIKKRVTSSYTGERRSVMHGRGITIKDHRIYAPGDDFRSIDWRIYARTDDLYIKRYEEDKSLTTHIIVDHSASMNFGKGITKFDYSSMLGVGMAYLTMKENEKFQFSTFSEEIETFKSKRGMGHLAEMVDHLNNIKLIGFSRFKDALTKYKKIIGSRALIVIISDFLFDIEEIEQGLFMLGDHDMKIIQVLDPVERKLAFDGDFRLKDSETKNILRTYVNPRLRVDYKQRLEDHISKIAKICDELGVEFHIITTDKPIFDAFYDILK